METQEADEREGSDCGEYESRSLVGLHPGTSVNSSMLTLKSSAACGVKRTIGLGGLASDNYTSERTPDEQLGATY